MEWCGNVLNLNAKYISSTLAKFAEFRQKFPTEVDNDWCLSKTGKFPISVIILITLLRLLKFSPFRRIPRIS